MRKKQSDAFANKIYGNHHENWNIAFMAIEVFFCETGQFFTARQWFDAEPKADDFFLRLGNSEAFTILFANRAREH